MMHRKNFVWLLAIVLVTIMALQSNLFAQKKKCMFITETTTVEPSALDVILINWLTNTYDVDIATGDDVNNHWYTVDDYKAYDFVFVSESISSSDTDDLKGAPVPLFYTELWASKWDITGWVPENSTPQYYGNTGEADTEVKIVNGDHPLAAGYATGTTLKLVTGSDNNTDYLTYSVPQVEHIPIAVLANDETRVVVMGIEAGTVIYNAQGVIDGSMVSANRCAAVGVNANANNHLTEDAFKLMEAGINWILSSGTAVEKNDVAEPDAFALSQNYPNPFNPTTEISFNLAKSDYVQLTVFNTLGQQVATLIDKNLSSGSYHVTFDATGLESGIYFYRIEAGNQTQIRKMTLMK